MFFFFLFFLERIKKIKKIAVRNTARTHMPNAHTQGTKGPHYTNREIGTDAEKSSHLLPLSHRRPERLNHATYADILMSKKKKPGPGK